MYTPRYGLGYVTQQRINAQLGAMRAAEEREHLSPADESGAIWRMLSVLGVIAVVVVGSVLAIVAAGGLQ
jgi:hypothetical protein